MPETTTQAPVDPGTAPAQTATEKPKKVLADYPVPEGGLSEWPADFDPNKHKSLGRGDFKDHTVWLLKRAEHYDALAKKMRDEAENIKKFGGSGKAARLVKVQGELDALKAALAAQGVDVNAILAASAK